MCHGAEPSLVFSTCLFCHGALGANDAIEHFPVGKRLAFDGERGRLWAVCPHCARWNLAPIEERWEAVEACEKAYRASTKRVSTDNIALARLKDGTDLVRIGQPLLPEFAAWRYGQELRQRARRALLIGVPISGAMIAANVVKWVGGASLAGGTVAALGAVPVIGQIGFVGYMLARRLPRVVLREADGQLWGVASGDVWQSRIGMTLEARLRITIRDRPLRAPNAFSRLMGAPYSWDTSSAREPASRDVVGDDAMRLLQQALPVAHREGASARHVNAAVQHIESHWLGRDEPAEQMLTRWLATPADRSGTTYDALKGRPFDLVPAPVRLAAEMALHEDDERRALAGELGALYARWEEAERIARIADGELTRLPSTE
jgi:hypothetical protein